MEPELMIPLYATLALVVGVFIVVDVHRRLQPKPIKDFKQFISLLKDNNCKEVTGSCVRQPPKNGLFGGQASSAIGYIGDFIHCGLFETTGVDGHPLVLREEYNSHWGSSHGFSDSEERAVAALTGIYTVYTRLQQLNEQMPGLTVTLMIGDQPATADQIRRLQNDVQQYNVRPAFEPA